MIQIVAMSSSPPTAAGLVARPEECAASSGRVGVVSLRVLVAGVVAPGPDPGVQCRSCG